MQKQLQTIHDRLLYLAKRWYGKAYENNAAHRDFIHNHTHYYAGKRRRMPDEILKTVINLLFSSGSLAATLTNYEIKK